MLLSGPRRSSCMVKWNLATDEILIGQWIKSKVIDFDINSDASLALCFVQNYRRQNELGPYVTLSKSPWHSALAVWGVGDSWGGFAGFCNDDVICIQQGLKPLQFKGELRQGMLWKRMPEAGNRNHFLERIALRRGWTLNPEQTRWNKFDPRSGFGLTAIRSESGITYALPIRLESWFWRDPAGIQASASGVADAKMFACADIDPFGRLVHAGMDKKLYSLERHADQTFRPRVLHDFGDIKPRWVSAPEEALKW